MSRAARLLVAVLAVAVTSVACGGGGNAASSPFCGRARETATLDQATQQLDDRDPARLEQAWAAYVAKANDAVIVVPDSLRDDYTTYVSWLASFNAALGRHAYSYADALGDEEFLQASDSEAVAVARTNVASYVDTKCQVAGQPTSS
jgi:hypothetical protein